MYYLNNQLYDNYKFTKNKIIINHENQSNRHKVKTKHNVNIKEKIVTKIDCINIISLLIV